jgi:hypothetical protein
MCRADKYFILNQQMNIMTANILKLLAISAFVLISCKSRDSASSPDPVGVLLVNGQRIALSDLRSQRA